MRGQVKYDVMVPHRAVDAWPSSHREPITWRGQRGTKSLHVTNRIPRRLVEMGTQCPLASSDSADGFPGSPRPR